MGKSRKRRDGADDSAPLPLAYPSAEVRREARRPAARLPWGWLYPAFFACVLAGFAVLQSGASMLPGNPLSKPRAMFTAVNAATATGFPLDVLAPVPLRASNDLQPAGQWAVVFLTAAGALFTWTAGGIAMSRLSGLDFSPRRIAGGAAVLLAGATLVAGTALLPLHGSALSAYYAAMAAVANAGLVWTQVSGPATVEVHAILLPLAVLGTLGVPVILDVWDRLLRRRPRLSDYTRTVLSLTAGGYLAFFVIAHTAMMLSGGLGVVDAMASASGLAVNARSFGYPMQMSAAWPRVVQWVAVLAMILGPATVGGAGGGLRLGVVREAGGAMLRGLRGLPVGRLGFLTFAYIAAYVVVLFVGVATISSIDTSRRGEQIIFEVASALGNVGLCTDLINLSHSGMLVFTMLMLLGKVGPMLWVWWVAETCTESAEV